MVQVGQFPSSPSCFAECCAQLPLRLSRFGLINANIQVCLQRDPSTSKPNPIVSTVLRGGGARYKMARSSRRPQISISFLAKPNFGWTTWYVSSKTDAGLWACCGSLLLPCGYAQVRQFVCLLRITQPLFSSLLTTNNKIPRFKLNASKDASICFIIQRPQ
jgi:hypothetical protein